MDTLRGPEFIMIDLFCGAGGTTTGAENSGICKVIAAVNHDPVAIASHAANHDGVLHITEDILTVDISVLTRSVQQWKEMYPNAKLILWASLECTNFSNAKGGLPRDADSRTLANGLFRYIEALDPDYILIENVREFMAWGDLDKNGKPVSRDRGRHYIRWTNTVQKYGYRYDYRILNAADYGAVTIRTRYFGAFIRNGLPFGWPRQTHARRVSTDGMFRDERMPWRPVADVLDLNDLGESIFNRKNRGKKPLVPKTINRIMAGLLRFHGESQIVYHYTPGYAQPLSKPVGSLTTIPPISIIRPILASYYGGSNSTSTLSSPAPTVTTKDRLALIVPWIDNHIGSGPNPKSIQQPASTVMTNNKMRLFTSFLVNPQYNNTGSPLNRPAPTVIASQKGYPLSLAAGEFGGEPKWIPRKGDSFAMLRLKVIMRRLGISDIYMRMLKVDELKRIQGFPDDYVLKGTKTQQKKFIGNSVETTFVQQWIKAIGESFGKHKKQYHHIKTEQNEPTIHHRL